MKTLVGLTAPTAVEEVTMNKVKAMGQHFHKAMRLSAIAAIIALPGPAIADSAMAPFTAVSLPTVTQPANPKACLNPIVITLVTAVTTEAEVLPQEASVEDYEASIFFALSQADADADVIDAALLCLEGKEGAKPNFTQAVKNVRLALLNRKLKVGTAALGGGGVLSNRGGESFFSAPVIGVGGGSANYAS